MTPLRFEPTFYCRACDALASPRTCPHDRDSRLELSGTKVREILRGGRPPAASVHAPEVAEILRAHYSAGAEPAAPERDRARGFILWFTGLSGAGKSTLAQALRRELDGRARRRGPRRRRGADLPVEGPRLLARRTATPTSAGSATWRGCWRGTASRRSPRRSRPTPRRAPRCGALAEEDGVPFVEVYAEATIESLTARDVKGLYAKALRGEIEHFTGVSDPVRAAGRARRRRPHRPRERGREPRPHPRGARGARAARARGARGRVVSDLLPVFLKLEGRSVLLVGGGRVARAKLGVAPRRRARACASSPPRSTPRSARAASPSSAAASSPAISTGPGWRSPRPRPK